MHHNTHHKTATVPRADCQQIRYGISSDNLQLDLPNGGYCNQEKNSRQLTQNM